MNTPLPANTLYIVSYPRSGNTWLINCLVMLLDGVRGEDSPYRLNTEAHGSVESGFQFWCEPRVRPTQPICLKSHDDMDQFRQRHPPAPLIYISRDARDCLLSYYFFRQAYPTLEMEELSTTNINGTNVLLSHGGKDPIFDVEEFSDFLSTEAPLWSAHVNSAQKDSKVCLVTYEELKRNFTSALRRIAGFLHLPEARSYHEVEAVYHTGFTKVFSGRGRDFFRRGQTGDWKNWYTSDHVHLIDRLIGQDLFTLGFESDPAWATNYKHQPVSSEP